MSCFADEVFAVPQAEPWAIAIEPGRDASRAVRQAQEVVREYPDDGLGLVAGLELYAGAKALMHPFSEFGDADGGHAAGSLADLEVVLIAALDFPFTGSDQFRCWPAKCHGSMMAGCGLSTTYQPASTTLRERPEMRYAAASAYRGVWRASSRPCLPLR